MSESLFCSTLRHIIYKSKGDHASLSCLGVLHFPNLYRLKITGIEPRLANSCLHFLASADTWPRLTFLELDISYYDTPDEHYLLDFDVLGRALWPLERLRVNVRCWPTQPPPKVAPMRNLIEALPSLRKVDVTCLREEIYVINR